MITPEAKRREWSLALSLAADTAIMMAYAVVAIGSGSLPIMAETLRGSLQAALGWGILVIMRRMHRQQLTDYDFGTGKLERFANFLIGGLLLLGAAWVVVRTVGTYQAGPMPPSASGWRVMGQVLTALNLTINLLAFLALWRAARDGTSLLMRGQVQARVSKLIVSALVLVAVIISANWPGTVTGWVAELVGGLMVVVVMAAIGVSMLRDALPDLLDRALDEGLQNYVNQSLGSHFDRYDSLERVRTRQSGGASQIEIALGFSPARPFSEVAEVAREMKQELENRIPGAEVVVVPVALAPATG